MMQKITMIGKIWNLIKLDGKKGTVGEASKTYCFTIPKDVIINKGLTIVFLCDLHHLNVYTSNIHNT